MLPGWFEHQPVRGIGFDRFPAIDERGVFIVPPHIDEIAVVRTFRLAGLAGNAGEDRAVPVSKIKNVPVRRAMNL